MSYCQKILLSLSLILILTACGRENDLSDYSQPLSPAESSEDALEDGKPTSQELRNAEYGEPEENFDAGNEEELALDTLGSNRAVWNSVKGSQTWTNAALSVIRSRISSFEKARDRNIFCPGYDRASKEAKETCWLRLVSAVAKFESSFHPSDSFREPNGVYSVGLLALSPGECKNAPTITTLKNPVKNIICGASKMAHLIARDGYIEGPVGKRGASAYWSVLRKPYRFKKYKLGKKELIIPLTRIYKNI